MEYTATVTFKVFGITADTWLEANDKVDDLITRLAQVETELHWDEVIWETS